MPPETLLVVIPAFNEQSSMAGVVAEWRTRLTTSGIDFQILLLDDGSTDQSPEVMESIRRDDPERILIRRHANRGHGQTCLEGYRLACRLGVPWVFQIDSDGQCSPEFFPALWEKRADADVVYGCRAARDDGIRRVLASLILRWTVCLSTGCWCVDPNVPYRLMRTEALEPILNTIPSRFFLANVALAVQLQRAGWRHASVPIRFRARTGGEPKVPFSAFAHRASELISDLRTLAPVPARK